MYQLLKDGLVVLETKFTSPSLAKLIFTELKPQHKWTIEGFAEPRQTAKQKKIEKIQKRLSELQALEAKETQNETI